MNITSENTIIYKKDFEGKIYYRARLSRKKQDNSYENGYIDIKLPKDMELEDKTKIDITKGFMSFYKNKDNKDVFYIVVQEFDIKDEEIKQENSKGNTLDLYKEFGEKTQIKAEELDDLPF